MTNPLNPDRSMLLTILAAKKPRLEQFRREANDINWPYYESAQARVDELEPLVEQIEAHLKNNP